MKEFIEKLIERLGEYKTKAYVTGFTNNPYELGACHAMDDAIKIVNQLAEEYGKDTNVTTNGWIPCSERLPKDKTWNLFIDKKGNVSVERYKEDCIDHFYPIGRWFNLEDAIAWMPLPEPFKPIAE